MNRAFNGKPVKKPQHSRWGGCHFTTSSIVIFIIILSVTISSKAYTSVEELSPQSYNDYYRVALAVDSENNIHIAWKDKTPLLDSGNDWDVFYRIKYANEIWGPVELVSESSTKHVHCLALTVDTNDTVHIVWTDETPLLKSGDDKDIYYRCKPSQSTWAPVQLVSINSTEDCTCPQLITDSKNTVHVVWPDGTNLGNAGQDYDIFYAKKQQNSSWGTMTLLSSDSTQHSLVPSIATDSNDVIHIVWQETQSNKNGENSYNILYTKKEPDSPCTESINISGKNKASSVHPFIATDSTDMVHVIWLDRSNILNAGTDYDVFYRNTSNGATWNSISVLTPDSTTTATWLYLQIDENDIIYVAWIEQNSKNSGSNKDVMYTSRKQNLWHNPICLTPNSTKNANWPRFVIDKQKNLHLTWWEETTRGIWQTYYTFYTTEEIDSMTIYTQDHNAPQKTPFCASITLLAIISMIALRRKIVKI